MNVSYIAHMSGKVQGVYFRVSSQQKAIDYGLSGYAKNLADGDVEVFLSGDQENVDKMLAWLKHGPEQAQVTKMQQKKVDWQEHSFFSIN
ncbi:acylphosphatase [Candidatus Colwellia aromaticivorans]|uniref:acylphosphatase n=1 Tax=Candidatus Colwellia aromaticivorans TaxID=2267621 RepID=UPI000DF31A28|nr:acylphosphatase [Candidatus Colwellia aromaticivorans]